MIINKYRIYCNDCADYIYTWGETTPTTCPINTSHDIDVESITIIDHAGDEGTFDEEGLLKVNPKLLKGRLYPQFSYFKTGVSDSLRVGSIVSDFWNLDVSESGITKVSFMPTFSYDILGGGFTLIGSKPTNVTYMEFILAPQIPVEYGGNVYFVPYKEVIKDNEHYYTQAQFSKYIQYNSQVPTANECRLVVNHHADEQIEFEFELHIYRNGD